MTRDEDARAALQVRVTGLLLDAVADAGFVLAGAGAIRQWGLTNRPTEDVDLFAGHTTTAEQFRAALDAAELHRTNNFYLHLHSHLLHLNNFPMLYSNLKPSRLLHYSQINYY